MIKFEEQDGLIFKILEEPVPLTPDAEMPCLVRFITHGVIGEYVKEHWLDCNQKNMPIYIDDVDSDGDVTVWIDENRNEHHCCPFPMFEIIGTLVKEGSKDWALYQMMQGFTVSSGKRYPTRLNGNYVYCGSITLAHINDFLSIAVSTGWQIHKEPESPVDPKERPLRNLILQAKEEGKNIRSFYQNLIFTPNALTDLLANNMFRWWYIGNWELTDEEQNYYPQIMLANSEPETPQYKVGDWVEVNANGVKKQGKIMRFCEADFLQDNTNALVLHDVFDRWYGYHRVADITRKLSPSDVVVRIGCLSGTVRPVSNNGIHIWFHLIGIDDKIIATIRISCLDAQTRELVESLLEAMQEEEK